MRAIILILAGILLAATVVFAAVPTATIGVPAAGERYYWFSYNDISGKPALTTPKSFKEKKVTADMPLVKDAVPKGAILYVLDAKSGNEAVKALTGKLGESLSIDLKKSDFNMVRRVQVSITRTSNAKPAAAAIVKLVDAAKKAQTQVLDPSSGGVVEFSDVAEGTASVTVLYGDDKKSSQDVDITLERDNPVLQLDIPIAGEIETIAARASAKSGKPGEADKEPAPEEKQVDYLPGFIGVILLGIIAYFAINLMRKRGSKAKDILQRFGIDVQDDQPQFEAAKPQPGAPAADPTVCQFCGRKKDASGACACSVTGGGAVAPTVSSGPRLVAIQGPHLGQVYDLQAGSLTIGREESNAVAFPDDTTVSRRHARIGSDNNQFTVYDEGSSNGTFVNGVKVTEQVLRSGDEIQIGATRLRFEA